MIKESRVRRDRGREREREEAVVSSVSSEPLVLSMHRRFCNRWTLQKYIVSGVPILVDDDCKINEDECKKQVSFHSIIVARA